LADLNEIGKRAKKAAAELARISAKVKNDVLKDAAGFIIEDERYILDENEKDYIAAKEAGLPGVSLDRLLLTPARVADMAEGLEKVASLDDPIGETISMKTIENGLVVGRKRVPLGVIGIIYEARPNVTADAFGLCFKAGNASILRGGKEALLSNAAITGAIKKALEKRNVTTDAVLFINDPSRESAVGMMRLNEYINVLIPRGGAGLIKTVVETSSVPVIETGTGNCHIFVDESADLENAVKIIVNAKTQRPGVCNACEKLILHKNIANEFLPKICAALREYGVEIRGDEAAVNIVPDIKPATDDDWDTEYLDLIIGVKIAENIEEAIEHIQAHSSGHSEAVLTESYANATRFLNDVDSACVYVNASTRFTDGFQFGFGAEIGISTQKLHARGPMGLRELTSSKYVIYGSGQIRE
jgi:glutamate-5-semialdehyde dehydrogenase